MRLTSYALACLSLTVPIVASAQGDPPGRVGRISDLSGAVSFRAIGDSDWTTAIRNYPLTTGDHLWTDQGARGEVQFGSSTVHVGAFTALAADRITDDETRLRVGQGTLELRVRALPGGEAYSIDTPNSTINIVRPGIYRVDVDSSGILTTLTVRNGEADVVAGQARTGAGDGDAISITGSDLPHISNVSPLPNDAFERYAIDRDRLFDQGAESAQYTSNQMVGYADLNGYGRWADEPQYGHVWYPQVAVGWAPYRTGHWAFVPPWGWTWIDDAPWGFAPFHYGRWAYIGNRWGWTPGVVVARPYYAPALVGFVGGSRFSLSVSIGGGGPAVGWFPLGPREVYVPTYSHNVNYIRQVNVTNVTNINTINVTNINLQNQTYVNQHVTNAVSAVPQQNFGRGPQLRGAIHPVNEAELRNGEIVGHGAPVSPQVAVRQENPNVRVPPQAVAQRTFNPMAPPAYAGPPARPGGAPASANPAMAPTGSRPEGGNRNAAPAAGPPSQAPAMNPAMTNGGRPMDRPGNGSNAPQAGPPRPAAANAGPPNDPPVNQPTRPMENGARPGLSAGGQGRGLDAPVARPRAPQQQQGQQQQGQQQQQQLQQQQQAQQRLNMQQQQEHQSAQAAAQRAAMEQRHAQQQQQVREQFRPARPPENRPAPAPRPPQEHGNRDGRP